MNTSSSRTRPLGDSPSKVCDSNSNSATSINELASAYNELMHVYVKLHENSILMKNMHASLKNDHDALNANIDNVCKEKMIIYHENEKLKMDLDILSSKVNLMSHEKDNTMFELDASKNELALLNDIHVCSSSSNDGLSFNNDAMPCVELDNIKDRIDCLSSTLNDCVHENEKIVSMCDKKNSFKKSTHHSFMYANVLKCTICG